jgi:putative membrane-bound dehydrogenase-like protein
MRCFRFLASSMVMIAVSGGLVLSAPAAEPVYTSPVVTSKTEGHAVAIDVDITGAKELYLVVTDGGNGYACDWADWAEPRLTGPAGTLRLTELKWKSAEANWGQVRSGGNAGGGSLRIGGKPVEYGIGTHANSVIAYDVPAGYTRFQARGGLDNGGTDQEGGGASSVQFRVYTRKPALQVAAAQAGNPAAGAKGESREPADAVAGLDIHPGLEARLFAAEPTTLSLTNLDVDHRGRAWVCEVVNYRGNNGKRPEGDRILILEDTDGDGRADSTKVYYQGRDVDSAMGICVLGNKVIVSCSPNVFVFTDDDGDDKPDRKELLFTKTGQPQHDHSAHSFLFGPDGKLYWNFGNTGQRVCDKNGNPVVDLAGNTVVDNGKPYFGGMPFRCNLDGSEFEVLGHNFRNNYEVTVDSFGTLWQSDNDDDGNRGVRINYVMEFGNYGYREELTGAGWKTPRTNMEREVPQQHWHLNDPGVVPTMLITGAGSPTGITVYEGRLLPRVFWDQVIHCDAGPNVVRAYPAQKDGAGYKAEMVNILYGARDKWFRPADVCVAPDGSLLVTDWYDPGVGGHAQRDLDRGRLFLVTTPGKKYEAPRFDFATVGGAVEALRNPNHAVRYLAWSALHKFGPAAEPALAKVLSGDENPRMRARALWLLGKTEGRGAHYVQAAIEDADPDIRIVGLRLARQLKQDVVPIVRQLARDPAPEVRRECAVALRHNRSPEAAALWAELALAHDGADRWYVEALGIGADGQWDEFFAAWQAKVGARWDSPAGRDIVWRSRAEAAMPLLAKLIADPTTSAAERPRYFRAFDFHRPATKEGETLRQQALIGVLGGKGPDQADIRGLALKHLGKVDVNSSPALKTALHEALASAAGTPEFLELVTRFNLTDRHADVLALAQAQPDGPAGVEAMRLLLANNQAALLQQALDGPDRDKALATIQALGNSADNRAAPLLAAVMQDPKRELELRRQATRSLARTKAGAEQLIALAKGNKLDESLKAAAALPLSVAPWKEISDEAARLFPPPPARNNETLPPIAELVKLKGDVARGKTVFDTTGTCAKCHVVNEQGKEVGPDLSEIGAKLSRESIFESILFPSAGISHNYETYAVATSDGNVLVGVLVSQTPESIGLKTGEAVLVTLQRSQIDEMRKQAISLMPADLQKAMTVQELLDVVEYVQTLKKAKK